MATYEREYSKGKVLINGRNIPYPVYTANGYMHFKEGLNEEEIERWKEENYEAFTLLNQIIALKQSCFLLFHTECSCQSLSDSLVELRDALIRQLKETYKVEFDNEWMEQLVV